uniref:Fibronectin type-III domain-containing protein n=1 Tax=Bursaphelenchus xylophilus TaxID=6326 RepID=A0A1I7S4H1_BURXY
MKTCHDKRTKQLQETQELILEPALPPVCLKPSLWAQLSEITVTPVGTSPGTVRTVSRTETESSGSHESSSSGPDESSGSGSEEGSGSGLGEGSGSGAGGSFGYGDYCLLLQYFYNISIEIEDVEIRQEWILFIEELQLTVIFDKTLTIDEKLVLIYTKLEAFLEIHVEIQELVYYTYIEEWSGYVFDLEAEKDCGGFDFGSQTTTPAIESTTEAVESTTHATGDCSVVLDIIKFQNNITDLSWSIDQAQLSWNQTEITRFSAYEKRIYTVTSNTTATSEQIFENVVNVFNVWTKDQFYLSLTYDIVIQIYHETAEQYTWGTVKQFCACA